MISACAESYDMIACLANAAKRLIIPNMPQAAQNLAKRIITHNPPQAILTAAIRAAHSHSIVPGGLSVISKTTRLTWGVSAIIRLLIRRRRS